MASGLWHFHNALIVYLINIPLHCIIIKIEGYIVTSSNNYAWNWTCWVLKQHMHWGIMISLKDSALVTSEERELRTIGRASTQLRVPYLRSASSLTYLHPEPATIRKRRITFVIILFVFLFMLVGLLYFYFSKKQAEISENTVHVLNKTEARWYSVYWSSNGWWSTARSKFSNSRSKGHMVSQCY